MPVLDLHLSRLMKTFLDTLGHKKHQTPDILIDGTQSREICNIHYLYA